MLGFTHHRSAFIRGCYLGENVRNLKGMAVIQCPECSGQVSDQDVKCPHCGHPLDKTKAAPAEDWRERFRRIHSEKGLVEAILYLRTIGVSDSEMRAFLQKEDAAGRIPHLPE
jgi:DNA-directed RNA polymerase subunit RPC12/RpoP